MMKIKENVNKLNIDVNEFIVEQETRLEFNIFSEKKTEIKMLGSKRIHTVDEIDNPIKLGFKHDSEDENKSDDDNDNTNVNLIWKKNSNQGALNTRQKRTINIKLDKDYYYDKEYLDNLEKKIAVRNNSSNLTLNQKDSSENLLDLKSKNFIVEDIFMESGFKTVTVPNIKESIKKSFFSTFEKILSENKTFLKQGKELIIKLAKELEEDFSKTNINTNEVNYKNSFINMKKTIKELEKYPIISLLIIKGKLEIARVSKFPYGETVNNLF